MRTAGEDTYPDCLDNSLVCVIEYLRFTSYISYLFRGKSYYKMCAEEAECKP